MEFTLKYRSKIIIGAIAQFISEDTKVLDIGCGNGIVSYELKKFFNCCLVGTDISEYLVVKCMGVGQHNADMNECVSLNECAGLDECTGPDGCKSKSTYIRNDTQFKGIEFKKMQGEFDLDFNDNEFDIGLFNDVLHHIPRDSQIRLIKDALRVCSDVLVFEVKPTLIAKICDCGSNWIHNPKMPIPLTHRTRKDWEKLFNDNHIPFQYYEVMKPFFCYPSNNYLFHLTRQSI